MELSGIHAKPAPTLLDQVATVKPPQDDAVESLADVSPAITDQPCMVSFAAAKTPTNAQAFLDLPSSSKEAIASFFAAHQGEPATTMVRSGTAYVLSVGGETIKMDYKALAAALKDGKLSPTSALGASLLVFDVASRSRLPQAAIRTVLSQMRQGLADGLSPQQVLQHGYHNVVLATEVESYVRHKDGLSFDLRRVASNGAGPQGGKSAIEETEYLETALQAFQASYAKAEKTGDYAEAFDDLQRFFHQGTSSPSLPHWQGRTDKRANDLAVVGPETGLADEVMGEIKDALANAIDHIFVLPQPGATKSLFSEGETPNLDKLIERKVAERAAQRKLFLQKIKTDDPKIAAAAARTTASIAAQAEVAEILSKRSDGELKQAFEDVMQGFSQWLAEHGEKTAFEKDYAEATIEFLVLADRFADALEALKAERAPKHHATMLPPDAIDQPDVLASVIEAIEKRLAAALTPSPTLDESLLGQKPALISESLRALIEACRLAS